jgi:hypothetical protein
MGPKVSRLGKWDDLSFRDYVDVLTSSLKVLTERRAGRRV